MSAGWSVLAILTPVGAALLLAYNPEPLLFVLSLRLRVIKDPIRALVIAHPDGRDWFVSKLPRKRS